MKRGIETETSAEAERRQIAEAHAPGCECAGCERRARKDIGLPVAPPLALQPTLQALCAQYEANEVITATWAILRTIKARRAA
jgi:hypothetical protein